MEAALEAAHEMLDDSESNPVIEAPQPEPKFGESGYPHKFGDRVDGFGSSKAGKQPTKHPKTTKAMIPAALAAHDRAQAASDELRATPLPENSVVRAWREEMASKKPSKRSSQAKKPAKVVAYCVSPSCSQIARSDSQYCDVHDKAVRWDRENPPAINGGNGLKHYHSAADQYPFKQNGSDPLTPAQAFRMSGRELRDRHTPVAMQEIARRKAKRQSRKVAA